jgi:hypothetical protein
LNRTDAEIISRTLLSALEEYGLATWSSERSLIAFCFDGDGTVLGHKSGVSPWPFPGLSQNPTGTGWYSKVSISGHPFQDMYWQDVLFLQYL